MIDRFKVSVIIPTFYRNDYLERSVESVLNQTYKNFELIIVDDSTDKHALETVKNFQKESPNVDIIYLNSNGVRQGAARNIGMKASNGSIISFLDDDDLWLPNKLKLEQELFTRYGKNIVIYGGRSIHDRTGKMVGKYIPKYNALLSSHMIKLFNFVAFPAFSFFKKILCDVGYLDEGFKTHEDWEFLNRIALKYKFIPLKTIVAKIYKHENNRDKEHFDVWERDKLVIFDKFKPYWTPFTYLLYILRQIKLRFQGRKY